MVGKSTSDSEKGLCIHGMVIKRISLPAFVDKSCFIHAWSLFFSYIYDVHMYVCSYMYGDSSYLSPCKASTLTQTCCWKWKIKLTTQVTHLLKKKEGKECFQWAELQLLVLYICCSFQFKTIVLTVAAFASICKTASATEASYGVKTLKINYSDRKHLPSDLKRVLYLHLIIFLCVVHKSILTVLLTSLAILSVAMP